MTSTSTKSVSVVKAAPTADDLQKLAQLLAATRQEAANSSPYMASLWNELHSVIARAHLRALRALARAERSEVLQAAKAAKAARRHREDGTPAPKESEAEEEEGGTHAG